MTFSALLEGLEAAPETENYDKEDGESGDHRDGYHTHHIADRLLQCFTVQNT